MVGGDLGSKALNTKPDAAYKNDQKILLQPRNIDLPTKTAVGYPFLNVNLEIS
jgi:hypothetical protein